MAEMRMFSADQVIAALQQENAQLRQTAAEQQNILLLRAEPLLAQVIDALMTLAQMAQQGHPGARTTVERWQKALSGAAEASSGIVVARGMPANGVGPK